VPVSNGGIHKLLVADVGVVTAVVGVTDTAPDAAPEPAEFAAVTVQE
jgi:hypothetical protein